MRNLFNMDSPVMQKVVLFGTLVMMNLAWLICCIPVVTVGAATTAMYRAMFELRKQKTVGIVDFLRYFRDNFKRSTLIWLIYLLGAAVLFALFGLLSWADVGDWARIALLLPFLLLFFVWLFSLHHCFALSAYFDNSLINTIKNAVAMSVRHMRVSIVCAALTILPLAFGMLSPDLLVKLSYGWIFLYPAFAFYWKAKLHGETFKLYAPKEETEQCEQAE